MPDNVVHLDPSTEVSETPPGCLMFGTVQLDHETFHIMGLSSRADVTIKRSEIPFFIATLNSLLREESEFSEPCP